MVKAQELGLQRGVGTFSAVNADAHDDQGRLIPVVYQGKTRQKRHEELINYAIQRGHYSG